MHRVAPPVPLVGRRNARHSLDDPTYLSVEPGMHSPRVGGIPSLVCIQRIFQYRGPIAAVKGPNLRSCRSPIDSLSEPGRGIESRFVGTARRRDAVAPVKRQS